MAGAWGHRQLTPPLPDPKCFRKTKLVARAEGGGRSQAESWEPLSRARHQVAPEETPPDEGPCPQAGSGCAGVRRGDGQVDRGRDPGVSAGGFGDKGGRQRAWAWGKTKEDVEWGQGDSRDGRILEEFVRDNGL